MKNSFLSLSRIRAKALCSTANTLNWLVLHDRWVFFRLLYIVYGFIWETISPSRVFRVVSSDSYADKQGTTPVIVKKGRHGFASQAEIIGRNRNPPLNAYALPNIKLYEFNQVFIHHGSDFVLDNNKLAINDYCALKTDTNQGYEDSATYLQVGKIAILRKSKVITHLNDGIMISGKFPNNYYHSLYENLIRLLVIEDINYAIPKNVPIIIDEEVYQIASLKRIFEILSSPLNREVVILKEGQTFHFEKLYTISPVNIIVPVLFDLSRGRIDDCLFDREYIQRLREKLLQHKDKGKYPKRFFITRKSTKHRNFNEDEVYCVLKPLGFERVAPEELTLDQQMALFSQAEWIISGPGAALTNLLFSTGCTVICLYKDVHYIPAVFSAPACFNDTRLIYFLSESESREISAHTENFTVNIEQFNVFVKDCLIPAIEICKR